MGGKGKSQQQLTPLELQIMNVLWDCGPSNVQSVRERLAGPPKLAYTTVQTMLNVLHRKGYSSPLPVCFMNLRMPNGTSAWCGRTAGVIPPPTRCLALASRGGRTCEAPTAFCGESLR